MRLEWNKMIIPVICVLCVAPAQSSFARAPQGGDVTVAERGQDDDEARSKKRSEERRKKRREERRKKRREERRKKAQEKSQKAAETQTAEDDHSKPDEKPDDSADSTDEPNVSNEPRPWTQGVTKEARDQANALYKEGNKLLKESLYKQAVEKYEQAIKYWNHPGIQYNLTLAYINLNLPIKAYKSVVQALKYGPDAFKTKELFNEAQNYKRLLEGQVAELEIICDEKDAVVTLDGKQIFVGPNQFKQLMRTGRHEAIARKSGHVDATEPFDLEPGSTRTIELTLPTIEEMTITRRRSKVWKPWSVVGAGALLGILGASLHLRALSNADTFEQRFVTNPDDTSDLCSNNGCNDDSSDSPIGILNTAKLQQRISISAYVVGGIALTAGFVWVYLNQPKKFRIDELHTESRITIIPVLHPRGAGLQAGFRF